MCVLVLFYAGLIVCVEIFFLIFAAEGDNLKMDTIKTPFCIEFLFNTHQLFQAVVTFIEE